MVSQKDIIGRIRGLLDESNTTAYRLGRECKIPQSSLSLMMNGKQNWNLEYLEKVARFFMVDLTWLATGEGKKVPSEKAAQVSEAINREYSNVSFKKVPVVGSVGCGIPLTDWKDYGEEFVEMTRIGYLNNPFILRASGDSMKPYIEPGDLLLCSDNPERVKDKKPAVISFNSDHNDSGANAKLYTEMGEKRIALYSINPKYTPEFYHKSAIYKIYPVIKIIREVK